MIGTSASRYPPMRVKCSQRCSRAAFCRSSAVGAALVGDRLWRAGCLDADKRLLEAEAERIRHAHDLQDVVRAQPRVAGAHGGLGDAHLRRNAPEGLTPVLLQGFDDALVERVD